MTDAELVELGEDIKRSNGPRVPIVLYQPPGPAAEFIVLDGRNRLDAAERVGFELFDAAGPIWRHFRVVGGDSHFDADAFVMSLNVHRRHLTAERKRDVIAALLKANPERSNNATATLAKVSDKTVASVR